MEHVKQVTNLTKKSYVNYTGPQEQFKEKNIIFGYNGKGKSSLASGIITEFLKDSKNTEANFRFFDRQFINRNLELKDSENSTIKGVVANFGEKNVEIEKRINELKSQIVDEEPLKIEIKHLESIVRKEIDSIHDRKKGKSKIAKKPLSKKIEDVIGLYNEDLKEAKKIEKDEDKLIKINGDNDLEKEKARIENLRIPKLIFLDDKELDWIKEILKREYSEDEIPNSMVIEWLEKGIHLHQNEHKCLFCGNELISIDKIKRQVHLFNENRKQKDAKILINIIEKLTNLYNDIVNFVNEKEQIIDLIDCENEIVEIENVYEEIRFLEMALRRKIDDMSEKINYDIEAFKSSCNYINTFYKSILSKQESESSNINLKIIKISTLIKGSIALEIKENLVIKENIKEIGIKSKELEVIVLKNKESQKIIKELKESKSNTKDFAKHLSNVLKDLEINLKLELSGKDYIIKHSNTEERLLLKDISEGEQNLLSLLYFYYELFEDKNQSTLKNEIKLLIVDDPITSMDNINNIFVLELIKKLCNVADVQLFVFTHVWDDFCDIIYHMKDNGQTKFGFWEVKKDSNGSKIVKNVVAETPYKHNFREIFEFSLKQDANDLSDCEIYHYPNIMRKILEEYLKFKATKSSPTQNNIAIIKEVLCGTKPSAKDDTRVKVLIDVCNILSHKFSRNPSEILSSAKFLMNKIKERDPNHYNAMKGN